MTRHRAADLLMLIAFGGIALVVGGFLAYLLVLNYLESIQVPR